MKKLFTLLFLLATAAHAQSIFIVRHAEKASADKDTPLSDTGFKRAECLAKTLQDANIKSGFATEFKRTQQTAEPAMKSAGVTTTVFPAAETAQTAAAAKKASATGNVLVVGHSNTVSQIVSALGAETKPLADSEYDRLTIVDFAADGKPRVTTLHYCISDAPTPAQPKM
ncbi:MAG: histidine phosphatase family protein [Acidobacteriales bacterium]|nr:histidine phosphatase family protein [Terriglobales bacterium]